MKSVYVDDTLHFQLKQLAHQNGQTLMAFLNRIVREGIERLEQSHLPPESFEQDPIGMFGQNADRKVEIEQEYGRSRYQELGEEDERF